MMPPRAGAARAEQLALVSRLAHERGTDPRIGEIERAGADPDALITATRLQRLDLPD